MLCLTMTTKEAAYSLFLNFLFSHYQSLLYFPNFVSFFSVKFTFLFSSSPYINHTKVYFFRTTPSLQHPRRNKTTLKSSPEYKNMPTNNTPFLTIFILFLGLLRFDSFPGLEAATGKLASISAAYVFGDSLVDAGNNNYLPVSISKANYPHNGVDFPNKKPTGRFCNGKNAADFIGEFFLSQKSFIRVTFYFLGNQMKLIVLACYVTLRLVRFR